MFTFLSILLGSTLVLIALIALIVIGVFVARLSDTVKGLREEIGDLKADRRRLEQLVINSKAESVAAATTAKAPAPPAVAAAVAPAPSIAAVTPPVEAPASVAAPVAAKTDAQISPEDFAIITAAIATLLGRAARIVQVAPVDPANIAWGMEGRRSIYQSHNVRR
jgi:Sec-independent protein translocase protein TatA